MAQFEPFEYWADADLLSGPPTVPVKNGFFTYDNEGALLGVRVYKNRLPHTLTGDIKVYAKLADGTTLETVGEIIENTKAIANLSSEVYAVPGPISIALANKEGAKQKVLAIFIGYVTQTRTDSQVSPGESIPDYADIIAVYNDLLSVLEEAEYVSYSIAQSLTDEQKQQARSNINAAKVHEDNTENGFIITIG